MEVCSLCYCSGKEAVFVVVVGSGYLSVFMWVVGPCLAVSEAIMPKQVELTAIAFDG